MPIPKSRRTRAALNFAEHQERWKNGCGSEHCARDRVCLADGVLPCHVLFVGRDPGDSETVDAGEMARLYDSTGRPFCGPAGELLHSIVRTVLNRVGWCATCYRGGRLNLVNRDELVCHRCGRCEGWEPVTYAVTNLVGCMAPKVDGRYADPSAEQIKKCSPRLQELVDIAQPRLIVAVGTLAETWTEPGLKGSVTYPRAEWATIHHPSSILRESVAFRQLRIHECQVVLRDALESVT